MASNGLKMAQIGLEWPKITSENLSEIGINSPQNGLKWPLK